MTGLSLLLLLSCLTGLTQATEFEVASIRPSAPLTGAPTVRVGIQVDGAQVRCHYLSLRDYLTLAYRVKIYQVSGPDWLAGDKFDIVAKLPDGATRAQVPVMLQRLLAERFGVKLHRETRDLPVYALILGKGPLKIQEVPPDLNVPPAEAAKAPVNVTASGGRAGSAVDFGNGSSFSMSDKGFEAKKLEMPVFADTLTRYMDLPVTDQTGLKGRYDFTLALTPEDIQVLQIRAATAAGVNLPMEALRFAAGSSNDSLNSALQALGLKLDKRKAPVEVLVVDHAEKTPSGN